MKNKPIIIIPFTLPWDWSADYQRQTCLELSKRNFKIYCYMSEDSTFFLKHTQKKFPKYKNITFYIPKYIFPFRRFKFIEKVNKYFSLMFFSISMLQKEKIIWVFDPIFYYFQRFFNKKTTLYDCVDYHYRKYEIEEDKLIKKADYLFVNSNALLNLHKNKKKHTKLVAQGFNLNDFKQKAKIRPKKTKKNVVGYIGGINQRIDFKLLYNLAKKRNEIYFEFWGPFQKTSESEEKLVYLDKIKKLPNVIFKKTKNKKKLIENMLHFDIGIIPYDIKQPFNANSYPTKLYEYFYLEIPVISTRIKSLQNKKLHDLILFADNKNELEKRIDFIIKNGWDQDNKKRQKKLAIENSWERKINDILSTLGIK